MVGYRKPDVTLCTDECKRKKVEQLLEPMLLTDDQISLVMNTFYREMQLGLSDDPIKRVQSSLQMENTFVRKLLDGDESGEYLALDLGGTNLRVLLVTMTMGRCQSISQHYNVPPRVLHGSGEGVFEHMAESIHDFMSEHRLLHRQFKLGFTFSFPTFQKSIRNGSLIRWNKSFTCKTGVGHDPVHMLRDAIRKRGDMDIDIVAILNDTTGTLMAGSYLDKECHIGLVMGTGCNAAYMESVDNVQYWHSKDNRPKQVVINTEWGAFGDNGCLDFTKTEYDIITDNQYHHKGSYTFEKLFAAHYIGDLVRVILVDLVEQDLLFGSVMPKHLKQLKCVTAKHISGIETDTDENLSNTVRFLHDLGVDEVTDECLSVVRYVCCAVSVRCAQLISAALAVMIKHIGHPTLTVAIDGSWYRYHPKLHTMMTDLCAELAPQTQTKFILAEDGSGRGAAFVAAVTQQL